MNTIYDAIDKEGKGYVSIDDLKNAAKQYNATVNETALINAFKTADRDRDGRITYQDFINFVKSGMIDLGIV
ncbi:hypothetical protein TRFO_29353 [Tritrichomonas foetus]|uniref:EF-hand domain-containing protein n=1 Tax=Tritrichomonas foetus TaxID=1144522 RepID=A0A1J4K1F7_9EUKA|nr:hypothetical protein TRFO_29353 [Tritrichomonas foetus]|eukprot:OHT03309.1 hypothetical protein TRFO_29353 [Tritrichomonas foetus]